VLKYQPGRKLLSFVGDVYDTEEEARQHSYTGECLYIVAGKYLSPTPGCVAWIPQHTPIQTEANCKIVIDRKAGKWARGEWSPPDGEMWCPAWLVQIRDIAPGDYIKLQYNKKRKFRDVSKPEPKLPEQKSRGRPPKRSFNKDNASGKFVKK
jgi:hypothetical protein